MARFQETNASDDQSTMGDLRIPLSPSDMDALAEARVPKARKPYMITKQREKWTEDEHKLFLEAMQLHGRAWRRIQEHIGTKTAVQIRSHAQKFFTKVIRESSGDSGKSSSGAGAGAEAPIQIPPPRPKRKSVHPYPCNLRTAPGGKHALPRLEKPDLQMQSMCEQGNGSPTSVVTASQIGSDCSDSDTSTIDVEERCPTPSIATAEAAVVQVPPTDLQEAKGSSASEEVVCDPSEAPQIKLFGKTVAINNSQQQPNVTDMELDTSAETPPTSGTGNISSHGAPAANEWSPWMANAQQYMYYVPQGAVFFSYQQGGSVPCPKAATSDQQGQHQTSEADDKITQREASLAESNSASTSVPETATRNSEESCIEEANGGDEKVAPAVGFRKFVSPSSTHQRGFMPYKRCAAESKVLQPQAPSEEADGEMTRLCL